jgi:hypothetical protein
MDFARPGCCGLGWPHPDPIAAARWQAAADQQGRNPAIQRGAALTLLAAQPADSNAWMRLAWADRLDHGRLTQAGAGALDMIKTRKISASTRASQPSTRSRSERTYRSREAGMVRASLRGVGQGLDSRISTILDSNIASQSLREGFPIARGCRAALLQS